MYASISFPLLKKSLVYLVLGKSDGGVKHSPDDALKAGGRGEGPLVSEEMVEVLRKHGAHVDARNIHGLTCRGGGGNTNFSKSSEEKMGAHETHLHT